MILVVVRSTKGNLLQIFFVNINSEKKSVHWTKGNFTFIRFPTLGSISNSEVIYCFIALTNEWALPLCLVCFASCCLLTIMYALAGAKWPFILFVCCLESFNWCDLQQNTLSFGHVYKYVFNKILMKTLKNKSFSMVHLNNGTGYDDGTCTNRIFQPLQDI